MATDEQQLELVEVTSLDHFVRTLTHWHSQRVKVLEHMLSIPDGAQVQIEGEEDRALTGDYRHGFTTGLSLALIELGKLPFVAEVEDSESVNAANPQ